MAFAVVTMGRSIDAMEVLPLLAALLPECAP